MDNNAPATNAATPPERAKITLAFPVEVGGVMTNVLHMRRPKVRDRMAVLRTDAEAAPEEQELRFLANLCDILPEDIENMDFVDYNKLQKQLSSFTSSAPSKTSKTP